MRRGRRPVVAIVGRPNVGKSALLNRLITRRAAIVEDTPGVTRDRLEAPCEWAGREFTLVDTGGLVPGAGESLTRLVGRQAERAIDEADVVLFVVDARTGLTPQDGEIAGLLRARRRPVLLVANKVDSPAEAAQAYEFHAPRPGRTPTPRNRCGWRSSAGRTWASPRSSTRSSERSA